MGNDDINTGVVLMTAQEFKNFLADYDAQVNEDTADGIEIMKSPAILATSGESPDFIRGWLSAVVMIQENLRLVALDTRAGIK